VPIERISREAAHAAAVLAKSIEVALSAVDLSPSQYRLLIFLAEAPAAATVLADRLAVTRPSLTALVDGLAARGFVVREPDPVDRRRVTHQISEAGRAAIDAADESIQERLTTWLSTRLPEERVAEVNHGLEVWHEGMVEARNRGLVK
jgi:DNA-binding MarR family transcriptional regulator